LKARDDFGEQRGIKVSEGAVADEVAFWRMVADDLGIDIVAPFELALSDGSRLRVAALVKDFGPPSGMLVAFDYGTLKPYAKEVVESGYGYSAQLGNSPGGYNRATMVDVLKDWGWSGAEEKRPSWLN
jgi:hypothetical protein